MTVAQATQRQLPLLSLRCNYLYNCHITTVVSSMLWRCWLGCRKGIRPAKKLSGWILAWLSDWSEVQTCMAKRMPLPLTVFCFSKIQIGFTSLVPAHPGSPGQRAVKQVCVCVCVCVLHNNGWLVVLLLPATRHRSNHEPIWILLKQDTVSGKSAPRFRQVQTSPNFSPHVACDAVLFWGQRIILVRWRCRLKFERAMSHQRRAISQKCVS